MDSILVVCYSFTGTSHRAATLLCLQHGWPLGEIHDAQPRTGGRGTMRCVLDSLLRRHPPIRYEGPDPGDFRTVVLVAPIWAYRLAGPMRTFVAQRREALRRVAVLTTMDSGGASNAVAEIGHILGHAPIQAAALTAHEVLDGSCMPRLLAFAEALQPGSAETQPAFRPAWQH